MIVDCALYRRGERVAGDTGPSDPQSLRERVAGPGDFVWVGLFEPTPSELADIAATFGLHPLAVEDALKAGQRPKLERFEDSIFLTLKTLWYVDAEDAVETGEIHVFMGRDFVVTVRHGQGVDLRSSRSYLEARRNVLSHGPSAVVYAVCDLVVDGYEAVAGSLEVDVDEVEASVFSEERTRDSARIYRLKRELAEIRRAVVPLRDPLRRFANGQVEEVDAEAAPFFRDVADHLARVWESTESLDGLLSYAFDAHLASISVQQNEDMRKISAWAAIIAAPTLVAGIYGMNFQDMPELHWTLGYPFSLVLMLAMMLGLRAVFKRSGWL